MAPPLLIFYDLEYTIHLKCMHKPFDSVRKTKISTSMDQFNIFFMNQMEFSDTVNDDESFLI